MEFFETSAVTGDGISDAFETIARQIIGQLEEEKKKKEERMSQQQASSQAENSTVAAPQGMRLGEGQEDPSKKK
eukprot:CAMPEP_0170494952 /NCGR_PEP_ID=MMETSP0208-20121228/14934_1 /TAXON_ID=197538 /ORGANISM="Strombidium inclinatum, Strain S3" /LENGTH=73 /DNA_ID=CAMNT_0010771079 /DNA_START=438 /DNA_END=656 /DNA_ORIENTATION=+